MLKKLTIILISIFLLSFNANAGSDGDLKSNKLNETKEIKDCFEKLNRATFAFNQGLDKAIIRPLAESYRDLPDPIQKGTSNAVKNLSNLITIPNNILQGDVKTAFINTGRLVVNTTLGLLGTIDVANKMGFPKYVKEDYGQTLGTWGVKEGCYFVLPVLGPTTVRDSLGSMVNFTGGDAWYNVTISNDTQYFENSDYYYSRLTAGVDFRAKNLEAFDSLEKNSLDLYASVRSLYLQDRQRKIQNLDETTETMNDDDWEEIDTQ